MMRNWIGLAVAASALTACVSVLPEPDTPDALYSIEAKVSHRGLSDHIVVREPEAARLVAGRGMVSEGSDGGLRLISGSEWSGPATRELQLAIIDSFKTDGDGSAVAPELGIFTEFELASRVTALKLEGRQASCEMVVSVISTSSRALLARTEISAQATATGRGSQDRALALKSAASECAAQASLFAIEALSSR